ncbi:putative Serine/arginine repetitive matrix protein [Globisporangium polare]
MASGGFFRGTSIDQDSRYFNQNKKLLAKMSFPECFDEKVDLKKVKLEVIHQWVTERITQLLGFEDDIVVSLVNNLLEPKVDEKLDPRHLQISITGFLEKDTAAFTQELWELLLSAQAHATGIPMQLLEKKKQELEQLASEKEKLRQVLEKKRQETSSAPPVRRTNEQSETIQRPTGPAISISIPLASPQVAQPSASITSPSSPISKSTPPPFINPPPSIAKSASSTRAPLSVALPSTEVQIRL